MSSDDWLENAQRNVEELERLLYAEWDAGENLSWKFTSDWTDLNPCIDIDFILFDVSLICFYILPQSRLAGFQIFGVGIEWSW